MREREGREIYLFDHHHFDYFDDHDDHDDPDDFNDHDK